MKQEVFTKKKEIVEFFLKKGILLSKDILLKLEDIDEEKLNILSKKITSPDLLILNDDIVNLLAALGIITIFISAGMEIDERFISKNKRIIAENMIIQFVLVFAIAIIITSVFSLSFQVGLIVSLALLIPSTSFIFSYLKSANISRRSRNWVQGKVLSNEVLGIFMLLIFLNIGSIMKIIISLGVIILIILLLPKILDIL